MLYLENIKCILNIVIHQLSKEHLLQWVSHFLLIICSCFLFVLLKFVFLNLKLSDKKWCLLIYVNTVFYRSYWFGCVLWILKTSRKHLINQTENKDLWISLIFINNNLYFFITLKLFLRKTFWYFSFKI